MVWRLCSADCSLREVGEDAPFLYHIKKKLEKEEPKEIKPYAQVGQVEWHSNDVTMSCPTHKAKKCDT